MKTVNIHEAKTHLSRLIAAAMEGEPFVIARAGRPLVQVTAIAAEGVERRRLGFLEGEFRIPDDAALAEMDAAVAAQFDGR